MEKFFSIITAVTMVVRSNDGRPHHRFDRVSSYIFIYHLCGVHWAASGQP